jgi:hypothetical protein
VAVITGSFQDGEILQEPSSRDSISVAAASQQPYIGS